SIRQVTNWQGQQVSSHRYYPFGQEATPTSATDPVHKFTGHERDPGFQASTPLDYMHARYCSPALGRFLSVDPVVQPNRAASKPQLWNRYSYALNNPTAYVDPSGAVVNLASLDEDERSELLSQLSRTTGLVLGYDSESGTLQILGQVEQSDGSPAGSATARADLTDAVTAETTYYGISRNNSPNVNMGQRIGPHLNLDFADIGQIDTGNNPSDTFNAGMIFLHELKHAQGLSDPALGMLRRLPHLKGDTVVHMNRIRRELGLSVRNQYQTKIDREGRIYVPFSMGPVYLPVEVQ
ncbi:MAG: RHS repeat-associated core domain-containing protein, partial [Holophagales bacterium]|nr:RHS repeat-associated core domain-containing protein [Holophagales bacterium]